MHRWIRGLTLVAVLTLTASLLIGRAGAGVADLTMTVSTTTPTPGEILTVDVEGCTDDLGNVAAVTLLNGINLVAEGPFPITPDENGAFTVQVTVPLDIPVGTALVLRAVCGDGDVVFADADVALTVTASEPPPTASEPTTAPAADTAPRFTG